MERIHNFTNNITTLFIAPSKTEITKCFDKQEKQETQDSIIK